MGQMQTFQPAPPAAVSRVLSAFDRNQLAAFIEVAIGLLDVADGDPDLEEDDDPAQCSEDEISTNLHAQWASGAGCEISDAGGCEHDGREIDDGY